MAWPGVRGGAMSGTALLSEALSSGAVVLGLSLLAETVGPRVAGVLSGAPLGAVLVYFFVARESGAAVVVESIPHAVAGLSATLAFACAYLWGAGLSDRFSVASAITSGLAAYVLVALALSRMTMTLLPAMILTIVAVLAARRFVLGRSRNQAIKLRIRLTIRHLLARAGSSALFVVVVIHLAQALGPAWTGLLVGFPMTLLPLLVVIHITYSRDIVKAMIRQFPIGIFALYLFLLSIPLTFPRFGTMLGMAASLAFAYLYLLTLPLLSRLLRR